MSQCKLIVRDHVNVRFEGLDVAIRKKLNEALKFVVPSARHTPQYKLGRWDGTVSFCSPTGSTYLNLLDRLLPILDNDGVDIEVDDRRAAFTCQFPLATDQLVADRVWPAGHPLAGQPIVLRDYQVEAIQRYFDNPNALQCLATGSGKTILTGCLSRCVEQATGGRTIIIVPSKSLVVQTEEDYRAIGLDVGVFYGDRKETDRQHTICTWQSLAVFSKKSKHENLPISIMDFIAGVTCVIVDECHSIKGAQLKDLLCGPMANIPIRWGLTGTIPKDEHEYIPLLAAIGPVVGGIRAATLQESKVLADCDIRIIQTNEDHVGFKDYESEHHYLMTDKSRLRWMASYIAELAESGSTLVLLDRIEAGKALAELLPGSVFISGTTKSKARKKEYDEVQITDNKIIIATYGVASVGLNIPRLYNCVMIQPGKSFVRVVQSIGRVLRRTKDKSRTLVVDISSNLKFSKRHVSKRKEYYTEAEYPFTLVKLDYR